MRIIGITGGIGSGKTTVCTIFQALGAPVYYADIRARELMLTDTRLRGAIVEHFGEDAYVDGRLNRHFLADQVFNSDKQLAALNGLVHPVVAADFKDWQKKHATEPYVLKEAAILFESGADKAVDETVLVVAPERLRLNRVTGRDSVGEEEVHRRMQKQWSDDRKLQLAGHVINNDGTQLLIPQVLELHSKFGGR